MKTSCILFCVLFAAILLRSNCEEDLEDNICTFVNPDLVGRPESGTNIPGCGFANVSVSNVQRNQPFAVVSSFDFNIHCSGSGKTYSGRVYDIEYAENWIAKAYKLEINGKKCGRMEMKD